jgi:DNA (cytosine-5)-methyltransferase 3A
VNVLGLFDGMSCGQIALDRLGIKVENYYASEIDKYAIKIAQKNYPNTIQLGDIKNVKGKDLPNIDLLLAGSPCQGFSFAGKQLAFDDPRSALFFEFIRLLEECKPKYFLLENVRMKKEYLDAITDLVGVEPILINSALVSAQNRQRYYWTNLPVAGQPEDKGIVLGDIIYDDTYKVFTDERITKTKKATKNYVQWDLSGKGYGSQADRAYFKEKKVGTLPKSSPANKLNIVLDYENDIYRRMHPIEAERCQQVPDNYTSGVSDNKRLEMLGNGWTVDVICHILRCLLKKEAL